MTTIGYVKLARGLVSVGGTDRRAFLQGLISQDIERVSPAQAAYGALLTPQGKYLHDFCLAELDDRIILDGEQGRADELIAHLTRYKLRAQVELAAAGEFAVLAVIGPGAPAALDLGDHPGAARQLGGGVAFVDPRAADLGCRLILPTGDAAAVMAERQIGEAPFADYDALRIRLGVPDGTRDIDVDKSTLLECNFEALNGVDWDKGCYIGQEVTARTKYRGLVKRQLVPVSVEGVAPPTGAVILADGRNVGEIRSIRDNIAIASLRLDALDDGAAFTADEAVIAPLPAQTVE